MRYEEAIQDIIPDARSLDFMVEFAPDIRLKKYAAKAAKILYEFLDPEEKANISSIPSYPGSGEDIFIEDFTLQFLNPNQGEQYDPCIR